MHQWRTSLEDTLNNGKFEATDRTGTGTIRQFGVVSRYQMWDGFPLASLKWTNFFAIKHELLWMLSGSTNIAYLKMHGIGIWDPHVRPATAAFRHLSTLEMLKKTWDLPMFKAARDKSVMDGQYFFDSLYAKLEAMFINHLGKPPFMVNSPTEAFTYKGDRVAVVTCRPTGDDKIDMIERLRCLIDHMIATDLSKDVIVDRTGLYSFDQQPGWLKDIQNLHTPGTFWPIDLTAGELGPIYGCQWRSVPHHLSYSGAAAIFEDFVDNVFMPKNVNSLELELKEAFSAYMEHLDSSVKGIDQLDNVIQGLIKDPVGRRPVVNSWNVALLDDMELPPCHYAFQFFSEELTPDERFKAAMYHDVNFAEDWQSELFEARQQQCTANSTFYMDNNNYPTRGLSVMVNMRSNDAYLGEPFNTAQYALLLHMVAQVTGHFPKELILVRGDYHIYSNHVDAVNLALKNEEQPLCRLKLNPVIDNLFDFKPEDIEVVDYKSGKFIPAPMAVRKEE